MTSVEFDHFLITRFNVKYQTRATEAWLRHRLGYFESLCHASVTRQTERNFRWLIYFDADRDPWFESEVARLSVDAFEPIWVRGALTGSMVAADLASRSKARFIISTRIDNDDAVARDFVARIQAQFDRQSREFVNFQSGLQLSESGGLYFRSDPSNAFISLIETRTGQLPLGVYVDWHNRVSTHGQLRQVSTHPMWLQMVHGQNIDNKIRGIRADPRLLEELFDVDMKAMPLSRARLALSQVWTGVSLSWRVMKKPSRLIWLLRVIRNRISTRA